MTPEEELPRDEPILGFWESGMRRPGDSRPRGFLGLLFMLGDMFSERARKDGEARRAGDNRD